jgi:hypothetical protein
MIEKPFVLTYPHFLRSTYSAALTFLLYEGQSELTG